jgi:SAM-dependent methyltransferase
MSWFKEWFQSPYYDLLYQHRDEDEARLFIQHLFDILPSVNINGLQLNRPKILDLACGNGRHCISLSKYGSVTGIDINSAQVEKAINRNLPDASFLVKDMREPYAEEEFDFVFNLFSSFGYFDREEDDYKSLQNVYHALKMGGYFIQDFLNRKHTIEHLKHSESLDFGPITFEIKRTITDHFVLKEIDVFLEGQLQGHFMEKVRLYQPDELLRLHQKCGLEIIHQLGNYHLEAFHPDTSLRFILVSQKM